MILVIGNLEAWRRRGRILPRLDQVRFLSLTDLGPEALVPLPAMVLSPLTGEGFDAVEVAERLVALGYAGPYRAVAGPLPDPDAVLREVREAAPGLDFDLIRLSPRPSEG